MSTCDENYDHFNNYIENFNGLRNVTTNQELESANEALDLLWFNIERGSFEDIN